MSDLISKFASQASSNVYHCNSWNSLLDMDSVNQVLALANESPERKARLCIHPNSSESSQITILGFVAPYKDKVHHHPYRSETLIPLLGTAELSIYDKGGTKLLNKISLDARSFQAVSYEKNTLHSMEVTSTQFSMLEIGSGPFTSNSTVYEEQ